MNKKKKISTIIRVDKLRRRRRRACVWIKRI